MFPEQPPQPPQQNGAQPQYAPPQPPYGYGTPPQQSNGQYDVLPPLPSGQNNGHSGHNPYEFIVNPNAAKHRGSLFGGNALLMRLALLAGGAVILMIVAAVVISALGPKNSAPSLLAIAQRQQEIVRVATAAGKQASSDDTKNFAANVVASVTSNQQQTLAYITSHGVKKVTAKTLALDRDSQTDTTLASAATAGTYDAAVVENLTSQLQSYEQQLQTVFKQTTGKNARALLQANFKSADLLAQQAKTISSSN